MTSPAPRGEPAAGSVRLLVMDDGNPYDLFVVVEVEGDVARVRTPYLFEIGEELAVRLEQSGEVRDARAKVRAHVGPPDARITELELVGQSAPRHIVSG